MALPPVFVTVAVVHHLYELGHEARVDSTAEGDEVVSASENIVRSAIAPGPDLASSTEEIIHLCGYIVRFVADDGAGNGRGEGLLHSNAGREAFSPQY
eukprot:CAMPEP_0113303530 /NCGR_PEP_ID=MMETSP0010_2-20120614/3909_1 /TAXON_ID=216773 ORGANISM="Corethron hystrix, Strain 308" /NCGR_SAMPLE_ID=MMETSP0010_2 /ASSEMBLY_ACC=CAM_ASM_000155 /LENGTH=97 /DNA_ID=CAMNT_0000157545 /DNA_START=1277 /DNA_END=1570 /DNA_ORIENTATION=- /assembly_acc=CAM_ASM_000155